MSLAYLGFGFIGLVDLFNGIGSSGDSSRVVSKEVLLGEVEEDEYEEVVEEPIVVAAVFGC